MLRARILLLKTILLEKGTYKYAIGVICGVAFSMAIILCTIGIMDGFEQTFKKNLKRGMGDFYLYSRDGFFYLNDHLKKTINSASLGKVTGIVQTEGFVFDEIRSTGVLVQGVDQKEFLDISGLNVPLEEKSVAIGVSLAKKLDLSVGDEVDIAFASGNKNLDGMPSVETFKISGIIDHGIYQKNLRIIYIQLKEVQKILGVDLKVNMSLGSIGEVTRGSFRSEKILDVIDGIPLDYEYIIRPYWQEYKTLFEAVKAQKTMISLSLQIIIVVSIFNVMAFLVFVNDKKSKEIFLYKALGMNQGDISKVMYGIVFIIWALSTGVSIIFLKGMAYAIENFAMFKLPGEIYDLSSLKIILTSNDYFLVFTLALVWIFSICWFGVRRIKRKPILFGLRREFM